MPLQSWGWFSMTWNRAKWVKPPKTIPQPIPVSQRRAAVMAPRADVASIQKSEPVRSEAYRRLVAALPCAACGLEGRSQCAHCNDGKAKGRKNCDLDAMPLCADQPGRAGCHSLFDAYKLLTGGREAHVEQGRAWASQTRAMLSR
jgi:hypothetical protein